MTGILSSTTNQTEQTLKEIFDEANLEHIQAEIVEYVAQHEGERLVGEEDGFGRGEGGTDKEGTGGEAQFESKAEVHVEQIMAFLKGDFSAKEQAGKEIQEMLSDPDKLAQLIMESVEIRKTEVELDGGESLADIVIGCLRKTYDGLAEQKKFQSTRGKASLHKAMLLLEKTVVDKIRNAVGEEQPEVDQQILNALREAEEQRQVEILAARYAEQRKKITKAEMDILEYIREHGEEKARALIETVDIPEHEWNRMVIQSRQTEKRAGSGSGGGGAEGGGTGGDNIDMGALAIVLDKLEDIMELDNVPPEIVRSAVEDVHNTVKDVSSQVETKIEEIENDLVQHEEECRQSPGNPENQKKRGDILLEISQLALKLAQPLTVISASIDGAMDPGNSGFQKDLLEMAQEAAQTMKGLMDRLTRLVGFPSMKEADKNILLYD